MGQDLQLERAVLEILLAKRGLDVFESIVKRPHELLGNGGLLVLRHFCGTLVLQAVFLFQAVVAVEPVDLVRACILKQLALLRRVPLIYELLVVDEAVLEVLLENEGTQLDWLRFVDLHDVEFLTE